ncbi:MAG: hypothetical protein JXA53_04010 [Bacteroidales bacterium]|nr:hypothetical protein [Bacteroidales bacterium]
MKKKFTLKLFIVLSTLLTFIIDANAQDTHVFSVAGATLVNNGSATPETTAEGRYYMGWTGFRLYRQTTASSSLSLSSSENCETGGKYNSTTSSTIVIDGVSQSSKYVHIYYSADYEISSIKLNAVTSSTGRTLTGVALYTDNGTYPGTTGDYTSMDPANYTLTGTTVSGCSELTFACAEGIFIPKNTYIAIVESASGIQPSVVTITVKPAGPQAPKVSALSIASTSGVFDGDTIRVNLPYTTYTKGVTSVNTSAITATVDSTGITTQIQKSGVDIISFIVGDTIDYSVEKGGLSNTYVIITSADIPAPAIIDAANKSQSVKQGVAIATIKFPVENGASVAVTGLPAGVTYSFSSDTVTITGIPTDAYATYNYTVTVTGIAGAVPATVTATGAITVKDPAVKSILYLTTATTATDPFYNALNAVYDVTARGYQVPAPANYDGYELIVLHESLKGDSAETSIQELKLIKDVDKPILNLKSYFYQSDRWNWGTANNGDNRAAINVKQATHPIFSGVTINGDSVVMFTSNVSKNIQPTSINVIGGYVIATTSHYGNVAIHEVPAAIRLTSGTSKYLMVSLFATTFTNLSADGLKLLDNAVTYLLGTTVFTPVLSSAATLSSLSLSAGSLTPAFNPAVTMYTTDLALGVTAYPTVSALSTNATIGTITYSPATVPGSITIPVIAEDGTTNNYVISVTATPVNETTVSSKVYATTNSIVVEGQVGELVTVMNLAGTVLYKNSVTTSPETLNIVLDKGVYLVSINGVSTKVLIK